MKKIFILGREQESAQLQQVFQNVNADGRKFQTPELLIEEARREPPNLVILGFEFASRTDAVLQQLRKDSSLNSVAILAYYPQYMSNAQSRGRAYGANDVLTFPIDRREILARAAGLLNIDKRRIFKTLVTIECNGRSVIGRTEDFSSAGISFISEDSLNEKEKVLLHFFLPGDTERIKLPAIVMRKMPLPESKYFYGARFGDVDPSVSQRIQAFIERIR